MRVEVTSVKEDHVFALVSENILVCVWRGVYRVDTLTAFEDLVQRGATRSGVSLLAIGETTSKLPSSQFRDRSGELMKMLDNSLVASAAVIAAGGLMGAALRSALTGVSLVSRAKHPTKVFAEVDKACTWIVPFASLAATDASSLGIELEKLRKL